MRRVSGLPLRSSLFPMGVMVGRGDNDEVAGSGRHIIGNLYSYFPEFNISTKWVEDGWMFGIKVNGSYTGVLSQFATNQSDAILITLPISPEADVVDLGPATGSSPSIMISVLMVKSFPDTILDQLFRFSTEIVILLLLAIACFALLLRKSERRICKVKISLFRSAWHMISLMMLQGQEFPQSAAARTLVLWTAIGTFFWHQIWTNEMQTEMLTYDTRQTAETVADVLRLDLTPVMFSTDPSERQLEYIARVDPNSDAAHLLERSVILTGADRSYVKYMAANKERMTKHVFVINGWVFSLLEEVACVVAGGAKFLVGKEKIGDQIQGPWFSRFLSPLYQQLLHKRFVMIRERGLEQKLRQECVDVARQMRVRNMPDFEACVYPSIESYLAQLNADRVSPVIVSDVQGVFRLFSFGLLLALISLLMEWSKIWGPISKMVNRWNCASIRGRRTRLGRKGQKKRFRVSIEV